MKLIKLFRIKEKPELHENETLPQGIIVGCNSSRLGTTALVDTGDVHALMIGAAGVGKTACWLYPNLEFYPMMVKLKHMYIAIAHIIIQMKCCELITEIG